MTPYENLYLLLYIVPMGVLAGFFVASVLYWFNSD